MNKMRGHLFQLFLVTNIILFAQSVRVTLKEVRELGGFCPDNLDNCRSPFRSTYRKERPCECDRKCSFFDDCCVDSRYRPEKAKSRPENIKCLQVGHFASVYAIDTCKLNWANDTIRKLCEQRYDFPRSPIDDIPVTDSISEITYMNQYCAICNEISLSSTFFWQIGTTAAYLKYYYPNITAKEISDNIQLDEQSTPGIWKYNPTEEKEEFFYVSTTYFFPPYKSDKVRFCWKNLISDCNPEWKDEIIREQCKSYVGALFFYKLGYDQYRNIHCAVCNNFTFSPGDYKCEQSPTHVKLPSSFLVLMDFNFKGGEIVSESAATSKCKEEEVYDAFSKKCRKIVCGLNGYVLKNGKCEPVS